MSRCLCRVPDSSPAYARPIISSATQNRKSRVNGKNLPSAGNYVTRPAWFQMRPAPVYRESGAISLLHSCECDDRPPNLLLALGEDGVVNSAFRYVPHRALGASQPPFQGFRSHSLRDCSARLPNSVSPSGGNTNNLSLAGGSENVWAGAVFPRKGRSQGLSFVNVLKDGEGKLTSIPFSSSSAGDLPTDLLLIGADSPPCERSLNVPAITMQCIINPIYPEH